MPPNEALKVLTIFEGKFSRLKEERDNVAKAKEALELAEPGTLLPQLSVLLSGNNNKISTHCLQLLM